MKNLKMEKKIGASLFMNEIKYSSLLIYQQGNSDFYSLAKCKNMQIAKD